jgi:UDP-N-acetylglucosamine diphosphorylase / glucose-1-phosphate thymidylyltransferase / UDP-N-acetylgalactosamine diphosphorylase / glucosamine-1-phosphate N-acetyltransferase / galactosamine-1-phosphate N-acetyltransferase
MQVVILAAGRGTRMGALTERRPKPMLPLVGRPKLAYTIEHLPEEIDEVIVVVGYLGDQIRDYFKETFAGRRMHYVEQDTLNGSAGALSLVRDRVRGKFLVLNGDDLYHRDDLVRMFQYDVALLACEMEDTSPFGVLETDKEGQLVAIIERPHGPEYTIVNTGAYVLPPDFFDYPLVAISETEYGLPQTVMQLRDQHTITVERTTRWVPIGTPADLKTAESTLATFL